MNTPNNTGIIYVMVPHQSPVKCFAFSTPEEFTEWLKRQCPSAFSWTKYSRTEWEALMNESDGKPNDPHWKMGFDVFNKGHTHLVEIWKNETTCTIEPEGEADTEYGAMLNIISEDMNTCYVLDVGRANGLLDGAAIKEFSQHKIGDVIREVRQAAIQLGWAK